MTVASQLRSPTPDGPTLEPGPAARAAAWAASVAAAGTAEVRYSVRSTEVVRNRKPRKKTSPRAEDSTPLPRSRRCRSAIEARRALVGRRPADGRSEQQPDRLDRPRRGS